MEQDIAILKKDPNVNKDRLKQIKAYQKQLKKLLLIPKIVQKSEEWYKARHNMISASDFAQALNEGKFGTQKQLVIKKCSSVADEFKSNPFFEWGNMFEPVAIAIYSKMHSDIKIHEFGLIKHPKLSYFGASPDGISDLGIMLEIKCPMRRKIYMGADIPTQYYYQIQGQLDVCGLDECDYFECEFKFYNCYVNFVEDSDNYKGVIFKKNGDYSYSRVVAPGEDSLDIEELIDDTCEVRCWWLNVYNLKRVYKDKEFLKDKLAQLKEVWEMICRYREDQTAFDIEIKNSISIETEILEQPSTKITGYLFSD